MPGLPQAYDAVIQTYKNPVVGVMEVGLVGAFLFHAVCGLWVILMVPFTARHLGFVFS